MNVELKRISISERLSEETTAFAADIWIDGRKRGAVQNDGQGGSHQIHLDREIEAEFTAWAMAQPHEFDFEVEDQAINALLEEHRRKQDIAKIRKAAAKATLFAKPGMKGEYYRLSLPLAVGRGKVLAKTPGVLFLSDMDDAALMSFLYGANG